MSIFSASGGGAGVQIVIGPGNGAIIADGTEIFSDDDRAVTGGVTSSLIVGSAATVASFSFDSDDAAIELLTNSRLTVSDGAQVFGRGVGVVLEGETFLGLENFGTITGGSAGVQAGSNLSARNVGEITSGNTGVLALGDADFDNLGLVSGDLIGVLLSSGGGSLSNSGRITGDVAIYLAETIEAGDGHTLVNTGLLSGGRGGVFILNISPVIVNSGVITATGLEQGIAAVGHFSPETPFTSQLTNSGEIVAAGVAYLGTSGTDEIVNTGLIVGRIDLFDGDDKYQGRKGAVEGPVFGGGGIDLLVGGAEENEFYGGAQNDVIRGRGGDDDLLGEGGVDTVDGGAGDDFIRGGFSADRLLGKGGDDEIYGDEDPDRLFGGKGDDLLYGGAFSDVMFGGQGDDTLGGGNGFDILHGGRGDDQLSGGAASDTFVLKRRSDDDVITDFQNGMDQIDLSAFGLRPAQFAAAVAPALSDAGGGATFLDLTQLGGNGSVLVQGLAFAQADASDFVL